MLTFSLQSGSNGNSIYVEADGARLLFDAGISGKQAALRMAAHGREIRDCQALILSHEHSDHTSCAGVFHRKFDLPIYCTKATYRARKRQWGTLDDVRHFDPGQTLAFGKVRVYTVRTPHDAEDTVCFIIEYGHKRLGIFTDLGHPTSAIRSALAEVDAAYLESNYEPDMLWSGSYPEDLKHRIAGGGGHLSNEEAAKLAKETVKPRFKWIAVAHLSEENNEPDLAMDAQRAWVGRSLAVHLASRTAVGEVLEV